MPTTCYLICEIQFGAGGRGGGIQPIKPVGVKISTLFNIQLNVVTGEITAYATLSEKD